MSYVTWPLKPVVGGPIGGADSTGPGGGGALGEVYGLLKFTPTPREGAGTGEAVDSGFMGLSRNGGGGED